MSRDSRYYMTNSLAMIERHCRLIGDLVQSYAQEVCALPGTLHPREVRRRRGQIEREMVRDLQAIEDNLVDDFLQDYDDYVTPKLNYGWRNGQLPMAKQERRMSTTPREWAAYLRPTESGQSESSSDHDSSTDEFWI